MWGTGQIAQKHILLHLLISSPTPALPHDEHALYKDNFATGNGEL